MLPYLAGAGTFTGVGIALDKKIHANIKAGDWPSALDLSSYYLPFVGAGRNSWDAWHANQYWHAAGHASLLGVEVVGLRGAGKVRWGRELTNTGAVVMGTIRITKARFGHTFVKHGEDATTYLMCRAKSSGVAQGQFLNNQIAAQFILDNANKIANGATNVPIPKNFPSHVIMPDGTFKVATHICIVPGGKGVKTAYPIILLP